VKHLSTNKRNFPLTIRPPCDSYQMIIHIPFIHSLRLRSLLLLPPPPTTSTRPTRIRIYTNLSSPPSFGDIEDESIKPVQELLIGQSPSSWQAVGEGDGQGQGGRGEGGRREVEDWPLKVQKMASVWSVTLMVVSMADWRTGWSAMTVGSCGS